MIQLTRAIRCVAILLTAAVLFAGCSASTPLIRSDFDHAVDFTRYRTFGFFEKLATDEHYETLTTRYLKAAVVREMTSRGYTFVEKDPDLLINFKIKIQEKQELRTSAYPMGYYGYRWGYYGAWGGYYYDSYTYEYSEGTLNIDLVERARMQMVWEGVAIGRVSREDFDHVEKAVDNAVHLIFQKYPFKVNP